MDEEPMTVAKSGLMEKTEGIHFYTDNEYRAHTTPGPCEHTPVMKLVQKSHNTCVKMVVPSKGLEKGWKFTKVDTPDVGSYEPMDASLKASSTRKAFTSAVISKQENKRFTELYANSKSFVPGVGTYFDKSENERGGCIEAATRKLSRPPSANRRRR